MQKRQSRKTIRRGFTLIEAVATIVILSAIGTVASNIMLTASDGYLNATVGNQLQAEASIGLDRIVREFRSIAYDADAGVDAPDIDSVTTTSMTWNDDYSVTLTGTSLMFAENGGTARVLLSDVSSFELRCFDESNSTLGASLSGASCDAIRRIRITITLTRNGVSETVRTRVFLRALVSGTGAA